MHPGSSQQPSGGELPPAAKMRAGDVVLDDDALSLAAKGVFLTVGLLGTACSVAELVAHTSDAPEAVRAAITELERAHYVDVSGDRVRARDFPTLGLTDRS